MKLKSGELNSNMNGEFTLTLFHRSCIQNTDQTKVILRTNLTISKEINDKRSTLLYLQSAQSGFKRLLTIKIKVFLNDVGLN